METMEINSRLNDVFRSVFYDETLDLHDAMTANDVEGWDSIGHITLVFAIEEEFGIKFSTADLSGLGCVGDLRNAIARRLA